MTRRTAVLIGLVTLAIGAHGADVHTRGAMAEMGPHPWHHRGGMPGGPGRLIPLLLWSADMTPDQQTQAHQILDANRPSVEQLFGQLQQANKDLGDLLLGVQPPAADALTAQLGAIAQLQQQLAQNEANAVMAIRGLLSPEQLAKADAARDQAPAWHGHKHCTGEHAS